MSEIIPVQQFVYDKDRFSKVIDTQFRELAPTETVTPEITVDEFINICDKFTNKKIFKRDASGKLIKDCSGNLTKINYDNI